MNWLTFALLAPAVYAVINFVDKYVLEKRVKEYLGLPIYTTIVAFVFGILFWIFSGFPLLSIKDALLVMLTGILTIWGAVFYFKALSKEETSIIIILFQTSPIMVLIMSIIFLKDTITIQQLLGFVLILTAAIGISIKDKVNNIKLSPAFFYILIANFFWAMGYIIFKFVSETNSFSKLISYESFGMGIGGAILFFTFKSVRDSFRKSLKKISKGTLSIIFINEILFVMAKLTSYFAITLGPVALVTVVGSTQVFYGILIGIFLTIMVPKIIKEDINKKSLTKKLGYGLLALLGIWFIS